MGSGATGAGPATGGTSAAGSASGGASGFGGSFAGSGGTMPSVCGDGMPSYPEQCDDSNVVSGDGCDDACQIEPGFTCEYGGACREVECGDGLQDVYSIGGGYFAFEQCDDGNASSGDGCDDDCTIEPGFVCGYPGTSCHEVICGDGLQDGYFVPGEGGSGGSSAGTGAGATGPIAGAGPMGGAGGSSGSGDYYVFEGCDDGNTTPGDGCDAACTIETGFVCTGPGVPCREVICGDGFQDYYFVPGEGGSGGGSAGSGTGGSAGTGGSTGHYVFESCDDGNATSGDGCTSSCTVEEGFICNGPGQPCREPRCGDGFIDFVPGAGGGTGGAGGSGMAGAGGRAMAGAGGTGGGTWGSWEQCDDGNTTASDGCSATCTVESGFACWEPGVPCHAVVCGDGLADWPAEQCDDGNTIPNDGCTNCTYDGGYGGYGGSGMAGNPFPSGMPGSPMAGAGGWRG
jgi:cysteine-rich repeat protein